MSAPLFPQLLAPAQGTGAGAYGARPLALEKVVPCGVLPCSLQNGSFLRGLPGNDEDKRRAMRTTLLTEVSLICKRGPSGPGGCLILFLILLNRLNRTFASDKLVLRCDQSPAQSTSAVPREAGASTNTNGDRKPAN